LRFRPNGYKVGLAALRAAASTPASTFEDQYKANRQREVMATRRTLDAETPEPRMTAAELAEFAPPDVYEAGIKALQEKKRR
jgi:hypothetical protein